jgi:hypothetical protein
MIRLLIIFALLGRLAAAAQFQQTEAFIGAGAIPPAAPPATAWSPTNVNNGNGVVAYWPNPTYYWTGSIWTDVWLNHYNLTAPSANRPTTFSYGGATVLSFTSTAANFLTNLLYASAPPEEVVAFICVSNAYSTAEAFFDSDNASLRNVIFFQGSPNFEMYAGSIVDTGTPAITNKFIMLDCYLSGGAGSYIQTNLVQVGASGNAGSGTMSGITIGGSGGLNNYYSNMKIAEAVIYNGAAVPLTTANRSNLWNYFTNTYGFPQ